VREACHVSDADRVGKVGEHDRDRRRRLSGRPTSLPTMCRIDHLALVIPQR
jgi:hypothetical protein